MGALFTTLLLCSSLFFLACNLTFIVEKVAAASHHEAIANDSGMPAFASKKWVEFVSAFHSSYVKKYVLI